jgi:uncharacterized protein (DUF58 family)
LTDVSPASAQTQASTAPGWLTRQRKHWDSNFARAAMAASEVELVQRRIYLLPTGRGLTVIVVAVLLLLTGINYQLSLAFVVAFLLAGLMQVALLASYRNLRGLIVRAGRSPCCRVGESLAFAIGLSSPERSRTGIRLSCQFGKHKAASGRTTVAAGATLPVRIEVLTSQRGIVRPGRIVVESRAPYGLIRAWSYVHFEWAGLVEPIPETPPPALPVTAGGGVGQAANVHVAHDPDSLREYVQGDSLRRVAWKQVAKSGDWYTRTGDAGTRQEIELAWQAVTLADTEARLSRMAAWLSRAHNENCAYSLTMPNGHLALADGAQQYADAMRLLAVYPDRVENVPGLR